MTPPWDDVTARARGLGTHLAGRSELAALAGEPDLACLASALRRRGFLRDVVTEVPRAEEIELGLRRWAGNLLGVLARWAGPRARALPLVFGAEDRRSLRAMFRGAAGRASAARRLAGLIPTPDLPERALEALAAAPTVAAVASLISAWHHPFAEVVSPHAAVAQPDLYALDAALSRAYTQEAISAARRSGSRAVRRFVQATIDVENGLTAISVAPTSHDIVASELFLAGGERLTLPQFERAIATGTAVAAGSAVAAALTASPWAADFRRHADNTTLLEAVLLHDHLELLAGEVRRAPLDPLAVIWFALRLRAQLIDLQHIVWTIALGAPRRTAISMLTTAA